jgi:hypothetical protein
MAGETKCEFLKELLSLQQDGTSAISAPTNWIHGDPLLHVETDLDRAISEIADNVLQAGDNKTGRWFFLIGSPGNGKSALLGKLYSILKNDHNCRITTWEDEEREINDLDDDELPYALQAYESGNTFPSVLIVQDASVVIDPYSADDDPAKSLVRVLKSCEQKGRSLVVAANRGVLESVLNNYQDYRGEDWLKKLQQINLTIKKGKSSRQKFSSSSKKVFDNVCIQQESLDARSLLDDGDKNYLEQLVKKSINEPHWEHCNGCPSQKYCPFTQNRNWLKDDTQRNNFIKILKRAELYSGQVIVFREAVAMISLILAGCPRDYGEGSPCDWVEKQIENNNYFALLSRRIYMLLGHADTPYCLEPNPTIRKEQKKYLKKVATEFIDTQIEIKKSIEHVCDDEVLPATALGVETLVGQSGTLAKLDPLKEVLPLDFMNEWDIDIADVMDKNPSCVDDLEKKAFEIWGTMEKAIEQSDHEDGSNCYKFLRRWSSNFVLHMGALSTGHTMFGTEIDELLAIIALMKKDSLTDSEKRQKRQFNIDLNIYMSSQSADDSVRISAGLDVVAPEKFGKAKVTPSSGNSILLEVVFGEEDHASNFFIHAETYIAIYKKSKKKLEELCLPQEMLSSAIESRTQALVKSNYSKIGTSNQTKFYVKDDTDKLHSLWIIEDGDLWQDPT